MIRSAARDRSVPDASRHARRLQSRARLSVPGWAALLICALFLGACTNSKFIVGAFYNRIDNQALKAVNGWTDLTDAQNQELRAYIGTVHTWHRRSQLPIYADLIRDMTRTLSTYDQATPADFDRWIAGVRSSMESIRVCHPAHYALPLTRTLTPAQIDQAQTHWRKEREARRERYGGRTREQRINQRVENITKWTGRLGLDLKDRQIAMIRETMVEQSSLNREMRELSDQWYEHLFDIARQTDAPDYDQKMSSHITAWFGMTERAYPEEWQRNRELWRDFAIRFEKTLSKLQRRDALRWLNQLANTLDAMSLDTPDWLPADDPAYGCVIRSGTATAGTDAGDKAMPRLR